MPISVGRYAGHLLFGGFQLSVASWWTIAILHRYYQQLSKNKAFYSTTWYPTKYCSRFPLEPIFKIGFLIFTGALMWHDTIRSIQLDDGLAVTATPHAVAALVYFLFLITEMLQFCQCTPVGLLESIPFVMHILSMLAGVIGFAFHSHGRLVVDTHVHKMMDLSFVFMLISVTLDYKYRNSVIVSLSKCYFFLLSGFWTTSLAFLLDSHIDWIPPWDLAKMENVTLATCLYVFLMTVTALYMFVIICVVGRPYKYLQQEMHAKSIDTNINGVIIANGITCKTV